MGSVAPCEPDTEGDDGFSAALQRDDALVARLLISLSHSQACVPWRHRLEPAAVDGEDTVLEPKPRQLLLSPQAKWGRKGLRSRCGTAPEGVLAAKMTEIARRGSPTTPLSWSGGSGTSGSVCGGGPTPSVDGRRGSKRAAPEPRGPARVQPLRLRLTAEGVISFAVGGPPGKKNKKKKKETLAELRAMTDSLSREQQGLLEDLEKQKEIYGALREENLRLKKLESIFSSHEKVSRPILTHAVCKEEEKLEQPQHLPPIPESQTVKAPRTASVTPQGGEEGPEKSHIMGSSTSAPRHKFHVDLNCIPDD